MHVLDKIAIEPIVEKLFDKALKRYLSNTITIVHDSTYISRSKGKHNLTYLITTKKKKDKYNSDICRSTTLI